ncbi:DUF3488 and transglutaminase-like domain-containing protein [Janibacter melonis]|nr:transglutaminase domain-containing protein [Janibacter melonis]
MRQAITSVITALAVLAAAASLRYLFVDSSFMRPAALVVLVVVGLGVALRTRTRAVTVLLPVQALGLALALAWLFARDTLWFALPTTRTVERTVELVLQSQDTITSYAAPAPVDAGVTFSLTAIVGLVALTADLAAATAESPTIAGLPVLALYAISAANAQTSLPWHAFAAPAALWLLVLAHQDGDQLRRWVSHVPGHPGEDGEERARRDFTTQGVGLAAAGIALAIAVPTVVPHLPSTYIGDGLRDGTGQSEGGRSRVSLSSEIDLRRSLQDPDPSPVLRYQTDDPSPPPLRVGVATRFVDGRARIGSEISGTVPLGDDDAVGVTRFAQERRTTTVVESKVRAPQLPAPFVARDVQVGAPWSMDSDGVVRVADDAQGYTISYDEPLDETEEVLAAAGDTGAGLQDREEYLAVEPEIAGELAQVLGEVVEPGDSQLESAQAIQSYLRGNDFTYSLELDERLPGEHPISQFLRTKRGYCQQFAATMVHLARAEGIPARFVVGFLPGTGSTQERVVRASDAHAWPELWIDGVGWLRFEPTPGGRAASLPGYSLPQQDTTSSTSTTSSSTTSSATSTSQDAAPVEEADTGTQVQWQRPLLLTLLVVALLAVLPLTALLLRERARRRRGSPQEQVEREWERLVEGLGDLGIDVPPGATPRVSGDHLVQRSGVGGRGTEQMHRVVTTLEGARYAPPGRPEPDEVEQVGRDVDDLLARVRRSRDTGRRVRAALAPPSAIRWWGSLPGRVVDVVTRRR